jgi:kinesin family protein 5
MRAKSIKNKARVNTELSPAELKKQLAVTKGEVRLFKFFSEALEGEVTIWRGGHKVAEPDWATIEKAKAALRAGVEEGLPNSSSMAKRPGGTSGLPSSPMTSSISGISTRSATPSNLLTDPSGGRDTPLGRMDQDEREDFLRRENELNDQLSEKVRPRRMA